MKVARCAIYTRKSTEDGLEQEFNSLDAQREACEAYIASQRHEGWQLVPARYDDGGFSGGNMDRPGLKALLDDIEARLIDVIVVYKVDRLTRSLADFAKIVERLDAREASFVSITQAFNTTTSMGRLTLNVLLSFAQFEREVTGERIRDKIAASKKKGLWMGGPVPLGYQVVDRKLVPVPEEAERVRYIMRCYLEAFSAPLLIARLEREGVATKIQRRVSGPHRGGIPFRRGSLFHLLKNPVYLGKITHKGQVYAGEHEPIMDEELWNAVQARLAQKAPPRRYPTNQKQGSLLRGLLADPQGRPMIPSYSSNKSRRYCYYRSRKDLSGPGTEPSSYFPVRLLDAYIIEHLGQLLNDGHTLRRQSGLTDSASLRVLLAGASDWARQLGKRNEVEAVVRGLVKSVAIRDDHLIMSINAHVLRPEMEEQVWEFRLPRPPAKPHHEAKLRIDPKGATQLAVDASLIKLLREAHQVQKTILANPQLPLGQIARREQRCRKQMMKLLRISWTSPRIVDAIMEGRQPATLTRSLMLALDWPLDWSEQERLVRLPI